MPRALVLVLLVVSCAHAPSPSPVEAPKAVVADAPWYGDLHALAANAAKVRGLTLTQAFDVVPLEDEAFFAQYAELMDAGSKALQQELELTLSEFLGVDITKFRAGLAEKVQGVRQEQLVAFYHFTTHRLFVRSRVPPVVEGERMRFLAVAHEVGHVLQDQLGALGRTPASFDEAIALRAVLEGDATLTATLLNAQREGITPVRAVERARLALAGLSTTQLVQVSGLSPKLLEAPPVIRELFLFPYFRGQRFVSDLYQAGGLELETWALLHPPTRSAALFSPQRWLDGRDAPLQPLGDPPRRLGALMLRTLAEQCLARVKAPATSLPWLESHYVDDSFRRVGHTLSWATAWDLSASASDLAEVKTSSGAGAERINGKLAPGLSAGLLKCMGVSDDDLEVANAGSVVGLVAGAPGADRERLANAVSHLGRAEELREEHHVQISAPRVDVAYRATGQGTVSADAWTHTKLGLSLSFPGARVMDNPNTALTVMAPGAALFIMFIDEPSTPKSNDQFVNAVLDGFLRSSKLVPDGFPLTTPHPWTKAPMTWTAGLETRGEYEGPTALHALVLPVCEGKASINVIALGLTAGGQQRLDGWLNTLQGNAKPPVCAEP
jgi:hypothetical protein